MKKIKSITDVITNSSTEVFLLNTPKSLEEVAEILPSITSGYLPPVILDPEDKEGPLRMVYSYGGLYDQDSEVDKQLYTLKILSYDPWEIEFYQISLPDGCEELREEVVSRVRENLDLVNDAIDDTPGLALSLEDDDWRIFDRLYYRLRCIRYWESPDKFPLWIMKGIRLLPIPEKETIGYWKGKIGFSGCDDNSIPYETWDKINETFDGTNYHLG